MGELFREDINQDLIGRTLTIYAPYFVSLPQRLSGTVTYVESSNVPHMVVIQEPDSGTMELVDLDLYQNCEVED
jgi:hypothetical protein